MRQPYHRTHTEVRARSLVHLGLMTLIFGAHSLCAAEGHTEVAKSPAVETYLRSSLTLYLSPSRTMGGVGGGFGVRLMPGAGSDTDASRGPRLFVQTDVSGRMMIGQSLEVRLGLGVERAGFCSPAAMLFASGLFGDRLEFLIGENPTLTPGPALAVGLELHPLRFRHREGTAQFYGSALSLGLGVGYDAPALATEIQVGILELGGRL